MKLREMQVKLSAEMHWANFFSIAVAVLIPLVLFACYAVTALAGSDRILLHWFMARIWPIFMGVYVIAEQWPMHYEFYSVGDDLKSDQTTSWLPIISLLLTSVAIGFTWLLWRGFGLDADVVWFIITTFPFVVYDAHLQKIGTDLKAAARGEREER